MQLKTREAARLLGVPETTLQRWIKDGELAATRVDDQYRLNRVDLLEFAQARKLDIPQELLRPDDDAPPPPSLADAIRAGGVHRGVRGEDKAAILRAVVDLLPLPKAADRDVLHRVLLAREALGSTGLGDGVAIPHPRNPIVLRVPGPAAAICYLERPVDFGAIDGKPVHTLVTLVCPSTRSHLHLLAVLANALRDPFVKAHLQDHAGPEKLIPEIERIEAALDARRGGGRA